MQVCFVQHHSAFAVLPSLTLLHLGHRHSSRLISCHTFSLHSQEPVSPEEIVYRGWVAQGLRLLVLLCHWSTSPIWLSRTSEKNTYLVQYLQGRSHLLRVLGTCMWELWTLHILYRVVLCMYRSHLPKTPIHSQLQQLLGLELGSLSLTFPSPRQAAPLSHHPLAVTFGQAALPPEQQPTPHPLDNQIQRQETSHYSLIKKICAGAKVRVRMGWVHQIT